MPKAPSTKRWSVYWERPELPPLRVLCLNEADARREFDSRFLGFLACEEIIEVRTKGQ